MALFPRLGPVRRFTPARRAMPPLYVTGAEEPPEEEEPPIEPPDEGEPILATSAARSVSGITTIYRK